MKIKHSVGERIFTFCNYVFMVLLASTMLVPFLRVISLSLSSGNAIMSGEVMLFPKQFTFESYAKLIENGQIVRSFGNTVYVTIIGTAINIAATILCAYPLSKKRLRGSGIFKGMIIFTMLFSGGLIPAFVLIRNLGLMDTYGALWFPSLLSVYNMMVLTTFFRGVPSSLEESAAIDGANDLRILVQIILPLSMPVLATLTLFYAVGWWNEYFGTMIFISSSKKYTMTIRLLQMIQNVAKSALDTTKGSEGVDKVAQTMTPEGVKATAIVMTITPIMCVYPFLQKHFIKGVMIGSLKG